MSLHEAYVHFIAMQYALWYLALLYFTSLDHNRETIQLKSKEAFDWFEFENSLDDELFYNVHRMDKESTLALLVLLHLYAFA